MRTINFGILIILCAAITSCSLKGTVLPETTAKYKDQYVVAKTTSPPVITGNLHGEETTDLKVFGRTYHDVRGSKPFYIMVTNLNSIVFVTQDHKEQGHLHIVNLKTKVETEVLIRGSFGDCIGYEQYGRKQGDASTDYIDKVDMKGFEINTVSVGWKESSVIDINSKSISRRETIYFDKDKKIIKRYVNGELELN